ncbi:unnamed protein product [Rotaria socialis]|uniref:Protein kinase domain-containing protein n=1 Tax=Rotaria socialis TaxID=392032 RepID=A0A821TAJ3_9BILA|nr:unnamed protein product [Rotaria socialis]CAF4868666.1 unnamed protein product [Rotaria socialis]
MLANQPKGQRKNETSIKFDDVLKTINPKITYTGDDKDPDFLMLFRGNRPDFTWSTSGNYSDPRKQCVNGRKRHDRSGDRNDCPGYYPWNVVSVIEKKKKKKNVLLPDDTYQLLEYLRSIVLVLRGRKYAVGCLTNYKMIIFGKASINDDIFTYEIFQSMKINEQYWQFLHCNRTDLGRVDFSIPFGFDIKITLGRGANGIVYRITYNNYEYVMKISNKKSMKEYEIAEKMNTYIDPNMQAARIIRMIIIEGGFITASNPVLNEYESSSGRQVSAYYTDDWVSAIYMLLLSHCSSDDHKTLQSFATVSSVDALRLQREVILKLNEMECQRDNLMDVDELYGVTIEIITAMKNLGLVTSNI